MCDHHHLRTTVHAGEIEHVNYLSENIGALFMNEDYGDIVLKVEDKCFHAHKVILAARSEYFRYVSPNHVLNSKLFLGQSFYNFNITNIYDLSIIDASRFLKRREDLKHIPIFEPTCAYS